MVDLNSLSGAERSAAMRGGTMAWGLIGSAKSHLRYAMPVDSKSRRRCGCGCRLRATHFGMANGVALMVGCELLVRRWMRDGEVIHG